MVWLPAPSALVVQLALPPASATPAQPPMTLAPSTKSTVPVATPEPPVTLAVKVTPWPEADGFTEEARPTVGATALPLASNPHASTSAFFFFFFFFFFL